MPTYSAQYLSGKAQGARERTAALNSYYLNPNKCKNCNSIIYVKPNERVCQIRKKKFCSHSCSAASSNHQRCGKPNKCLTCKKLIPAHKQYCNRTCSARRLRISHLNGLTKGDIFNRYKNYQSARSSIREHATAVFFSLNRESKCICGYTKHIDVAHRKSVKSFPSTAFITEINDPTNLIGLCPNCHWEFDHNLLQIGSGEFELHNLRTVK